MSDQKQKQRDKFQSSWQKLVQLSGHPKPETAPKVPSSSVTSVFKEIAEERAKKAEEEFKVKISGILQAKLELDKTLKKGREDLAKKEEKEYETLNNALEDAFRMLENVKKEGKDLIDAAEGNFSSGTEDDKTED